MTIHLVTFSDASMERSRQLCVEGALCHGVDKAHPFTQDYLKWSMFYLDYKDILDNPKGAGLWLWKPWAIAQIIRECDDGEYIVYADAGIEFINNVHYIIDRMDQDIFLFGNNWEHAHWCKADVIAEIMPEWFHLGIPFKQADGSIVKSISPWAAFGKQVQASVIFFRVSDYSRRFVKEWLGWCLFEGGRLIDDSPSRTPNHPEFREHRHDQAILTTMAYRDGLRLHYWPAMYNDGAFTYEKLPEYAGDDYPILFHHHRRRQADWAEEDEARTAEAFAERAWSGNG